MHPKKLYTILSFKLFDFFLGFFENNTFHFDFLQDFAVFAGSLWRYAFLDELFNFFVHVQGLNNLFIKAIVRSNFVDESVNLDGTVILDRVDVFPKNEYLTHSFFCIF